MKMSKEKTAIQILIDEIDLHIVYGLSDTLRYSLEDCKNMAKSLLEKEQEQIEQAYAQGVEDCLIVLKTGKSISSNDYYRSKYVK